MPSVVIISSSRERSCSKWTDDMPPQQPTVAKTYHASLRLLLRMPSTPVRQLGARTQDCLGGVTSLSTISTSREHGPDDISRNPYPRNLKDLQCANLRLCRTSVGLRSVQTDSRLPPSYLKEPSRPFRRHSCFRLTALHGCMLTRYTMENPWCS